MIVDINVAHKVFMTDKDKDFKPVHERLFKDKKNKVCIVFGGKLAREYAVSASLIRMVALLSRAGRAIKISDELVEKQTLKISEAEVCCSDDQHIIALAIVSNTRLLCSHDKYLHADFTNTNILSTPKGKVYQTAKHVHLLNTHCRKSKLCGT